MFTQCLMHHAVRPQQEWRGNSGDSAPIHHSAMAETCLPSQHWPTHHSHNPAAFLHSPFSLHSLFLFSFPTFLPSSPSLFLCLFTTLVSTPFLFLPLSFNKCLKGSVTEAAEWGGEVKWREILRKSELLLIKKRRRRKKNTSIFCIDQRFLFIYLFSSSPSFIQVHTSKLFFFRTNTIRDFTLVSLYLQTINIEHLHSIVLLVTQHNPVY